MDLDALRLAAWRSVRSASELAMEGVSRDLEAATGLPTDWYEVLLSVYESGGVVSQSKLESAASLSQSGISRLVSKMAGAGLLSRERSSEDRRNVYVALTDSGRDTLLRATPAYNRAVHQHFGSLLSDEEASSISATLTRVCESAGQTRTEAEEDLDLLVRFGQTMLSLTSNTMLVSDALSLREALEESMLLDAARHITREGVNECRALVTRMSSHLTSPRDFFVTDWELHKLIAGYCDNTLLRSVYLELVKVITHHLDHFVLTADIGDYLYERLAVHAQLVDAIASGAPDEIKRAAERHSFTKGGLQLLEERAEPAQR